jgi:ABC-2 type transport system permease protein
VFVPKDQLSNTLRDIANAFPVIHLNDALFKAFDPATTGSGIAASHLLILAAWGVGGLIVALWRFSWSPRSA